MAERDMGDKFNIREFSSMGPGKRLNATGSPGPACPLVHRTGRAEIGGVDPLTEKAHNRIVSDAPSVPKQMAAFSPQKYFRSHNPALLRAPQAFAT